MSYGLAVRTERLKHSQTGKTFLIALDASLFSGPIGHLSDPHELMQGLSSAGQNGDIQGILAFHGFFETAVSPSFRIPRIMSATASTERNDPRDKTPIATATNLVAAGADAIGIHLSIGHPNSSKMLTNTGALVFEAHALGIPVLIASYVVGTDSASPTAVVHAATIARDLGADVIKIMYPGSASALRDIVAASSPAITVLAGGERQSDNESYELARQASASGAGICFGRSIFEAGNPASVVRDLAKIIHGA